MKKKKPHDLNLPSDFQGRGEEWRQKKTQEFIALKRSLDSLCFGAAYLPEGCGNAVYMIQRYIVWLDEAIKEWK